MECLFVKGYFVELQWANWKDQVVHVRSINPNAMNAYHFFKLIAPVWLGAIVIISVDLYVQTLNRRPYSTLSHPNLVSIKGISVDWPQLWIVEEYYEDNLFNYVKTAERLAPSLQLKIARELVKVQQTQTREEKKQAPSLTAIFIH